MTEIAVIEDDPSMCTALERLLRAVGFQVVVFPSAEEFLGRSGQERFSCLVLDIHLGGMIGFDLHEQLAAAGATIPVIFITAHDDGATRERARKAGAAAYLRKPFDRADLLRAIHGAVGRAA
jgi:FixJ family two-component response regulator